MNYLEPLLPGLFRSLQLTGGVLAFGLPLGVLCGLVMHVSPKRISFLVVAITELGRGFPALVTLYVVYFGLPDMGLTLDSFTAVVVAFGFTTASYTAEIFRAAIAGVAQSQWEAGRALGLSPQVILARIVLPQALRRVVTPVVGFCIIIFQGSALAYSVGESELLARAYSEGTLSFDMMPYLLAAAALYLSCVLVLQLVLSSASVYREWLSTSRAVSIA